MIVSNPKSLKALLREEDGGPTIEYLLVFVGMIFFIFFAFQVIVGFYFSASAEKAAERGARLAAVREPAVTGFNVRNTPAPGADADQLCANGGCLPQNPGVWTCTGGTSPGCNAAAFNAIYTEIRRYTYVANPGDVTISYTDTGAMGYATGPFTPLIEVSITPSWQIDTFSGISSFLGFLPDSITLPTLRATAIGGGLGQLG